MRKSGRSALKTLVRILRGCALKKRSLLKGWERQPQYTTKKDGTDGEYTRHLNGGIENNFG
jgi:hypothetical protein